MQVSISLSEILFILFHMPTCDDGTLTRVLQCKLAGGDGSPGRWKHGTYNFPLTRGKKMIIVSASTTITTPVVVVVFVWLLLCFFGIYFALFPQCMSVCRRSSL